MAIPDFNCSIFCLTRPNSTLQYTSPSDDNLNLHLWTNLHYVLIFQRWQEPMIIVTMWLVGVMLMLLLKPQTVVMLQMILMTGYALHLLPQVQLERLTKGFNVQYILLLVIIFTCKTLNMQCNQNLFWKRGTVGLSLKFHVTCSYDIHTCFKLVTLWVNCTNKGHFTCKI